MHPDTSTLIQPFQPLSTEERLILLDVIDELDAVTTRAEFVACTAGLLQRILPHGGISVGIGNFVETSIVPIADGVLIHNFPKEVMDALQRPDGGLRSPMVERWRELRRPVLVQLDGNIEAALGADRVAHNHRWLANAHKYGHRNVLANGFRDLEGKVGSFFSFVRIPEILGWKHAYLIERLTPFLHMALARALIPNGKSGLQTATAKNLSLSDRQIEILHWLRLGKTNGEIACIIECSEANIKYHLKEIFERLNVTNRTLAVARAIDLGILT